MMQKNAEKEAKKAEENSDADFWNSLLIRSAEEQAEVNRQLDEIVAEIKAIADLESLRKAELTVTGALIKGLIDSKQAPSVANLLKHQQDLLKDLKPIDQGLGDTGRKLVVLMASDLSDKECWDLLQDFPAKMKALEDKAREEVLTIEARNIDETGIIDGGIIGGERLQPAPIQAPDLF